MDMCAVGVQLQCQNVMDVYEASVATGSERDLVLLRSTFLIFTSVGLDVSFSNV